MSSAKTDTVTITSIDESELAGPSGRVVNNNPTLFDSAATTVPPLADPMKTEVNVPTATTDSSHSIPSTSSQLDSTPSPAETTTATSPDATTNNTENPEGGGEEKKDESMFECNICLDTAKDAVVSMCGHLFCWPCLHQWLETRPRRQLCPVCKAAISKEKVIPLYGRGSTNQQDPRTKVPPRPQGQRAEPEPGGFQGFGLGDSGFHMSFGIGAFPLGYLNSSFNFDGRGRAAERGTAQFDEEQFLSKVFIWVATIFLAWLVFVY